MLAQNKKEVLQCNKAKQRMQTLLSGSGALGARCSTALKLFLVANGGWALGYYAERGEDRRG